ncbi:hypothetical protein F8271_01990 [Micromonospora sp. ALFpr18c]|uniref:hypothetical protein n=1 Tax=unclassified Micromonospora TaxID=2617518 RepID=UPI00124B4B3C|nr:hypothetical protein [Micromonospora sp. ALFpr18c]KAB1948762.1 hypothetical protein F8271_01990 [Micromonospora sp. ALFpr18c]
MTLQLWTGEPPQQPVSPAANDGWEEQDASDCELFAGDLRASIVTEGPTDLFIEIPAAGGYRARLYVRGRQELGRAFDRWHIEPVEIDEALCASMDDDGGPSFPAGHEKFLIQVWPRA